MKSNGPWQIKSSEEKYKNPWIKVHEDQVIRPDGKNGIFGVVEMVPGISVLPLDDNGYVYLTKEFHYATEQEGIEVVSGAIEQGESALTAAKRELKEELGIEADEWTDLGNVNPFTNVVKSPAQIFLARGLHFLDKNPDATEKISTVKIEFEEAIQMVMDSRITHGPSCVLILKTARYLKYDK